MRAAVRAMLEKEEREAEPVPPLRVLLARTAGELYRLAVRLTGDLDEADDVIQTAYLNAFEALRAGQFRGERFASRPTGSATWSLRLRCAALTGSLSDLCWYFLRLGALGFGGPIALAGYMQRDLVEERKWISPDDYKEGLALSQLAPGPLAAQLAMYLGWVKGGTLGATLTGVCFVVPSFAMVLGLAWAYLRFGGLPWMQGAFYGVGAAVIAIIARSVGKLVKLTLKRDRLLWALFLVLAVTTAWTEQEIVWLFLAAGVIAVAVRSRQPPAPGAAAALMPWLFTGLHGAAEPATLWKLTWFFASAGAFVFGSGLAIVPFLHGSVVKDFGWLTEQQFLDVSRQRNKAGGSRPW